jgi:ribonuclease HI
MIIEVYSDGSSDGKSGGVGGWAFVVLVDGVKVHEDSGSQQNATNNIAEILGATKGLEWVNNQPENDDVTLISDSQCVLRWATGEYRVKKPHLFVYVIALRKAFDKAKAKTRWEPGHKGEPNNERADSLAKAARHKDSGVPQEDTDGKECQSSILPSR